MLLRLLVAPAQLSQAPAQGVPTSARSPALLARGGGGWRSLEPLQTASPPAEGRQRLLQRVWGTGGAKPGRGMCKPGSEAWRISGLSRLPPSAAPGGSARAMGLPSTLSLPGQNLVPGWYGRLPGCRGLCCCPAVGTRRGRGLQSLPQRAGGGAGAADGRAHVLVCLQLAWWYHTRSLDRLEW